MKKNGVLNKDLSDVIASVGHLDNITVCDAGFPIPDRVRRIDLAIEANVPSFISVIKAISKELEVQEIIFASELSDKNNSLIESIKEIFPNASVSYVSHEELKKKSGNSRAVIRTGECTPYANVILVSGVTF